MAKIKDTSQYPIDDEIKLEDYLIGTEEETGKTKNYSVSGLFELFKTEMNPPDNSCPERTIIQDVRSYTGEISYYNSVFTNLTGNTSGGIPPEVLDFSGGVNAVYFKNKTGNAYMSFYATQRDNPLLPLQERKDIFCLKLAPQQSAVINYEEVLNVFGYDGQGKLGFNISFFSDSDYSIPLVYNGNGVLDVIIIKTGTVDCSEDFNDGGCGSGDSGIGLMLLQD